MPKLHDAEVSILVDGEALPEYQIVQIDNAVKCYVPSETGKSFEIRMDDRGSGHKGANIYISARVQMDGTPLHNICVRNRSTRGRTLSGVFSSDNSYRHPFYFASLKVTDGGDYGDPQVGCIKVTALWKQGAGYRILNVPRIPEQVINRQLEDKAVHEKSKKLTTHRVLLGDPVALHSGGKIRKPLSTEVELPILEFYFQYANKDLLMARDIIPPILQRTQNVATTPGVNTKKRTLEIESVEDEEELTKEEAAILKRLQAKATRGEQARMKRIKVEVKAEVKPEPGLISSSSRSGVIDLTSDD